MDACQVEGCLGKVTKAGHRFCLEHWKAEGAGKVTRCTACGQWHEGTAALCARCAKAPAASGDVGEEEAAGSMLSSTKIGKHFGLSNIKTNLVLADFGWIEKYVKGWTPTDRGNALGANVREMRNGTPFVVWPESILTNSALRKSVAELTDVVARPAADAKEPKPRESSGSAGADDFRKKFIGNYCTQDGHFVKSRAEAMIDNWLYQQKIAHAYERRLPLDEDCYCDFYLPEGNVYIEYWGRESDPKYRERMAIKQAIYAKHGLRLIELGDAEIERLDDVLPRLLLRFGIDSV